MGFRLMIIKITKKAIKTYMKGDSIILTIVCFLCSLYDVLKSAFQAKLQPGFMRIMFSQLEALYENR